MERDDAIVSFHRDLRVHDPPALSTARSEYDRIVPVFVLDPRLYDGRFAWTARTESARRWKHAVADDRFQPDGTTNRVACSVWVACR